MNLKLAAIISFFFFCTPAFAERFSTEISSKEKLASAYAMILNPVEDEDSLVAPKSKLIPAIVQQTGLDTWDVTFEADAESISGQTRYSIVATTSSGRVLPGNVKWLKNSRPQFIANASCDQDNIAGEIEKLIGTDERALEILVQVRKTRQDVLRRQLKALLRDPIITQLNREEANLGLYHQRVISQDTPLEELADRIAKIRILKNAKP